MRIQHNIMAMNAYRNLGANNRGLSKNLEKLASGYRINRAGDDAAGLAISEKMRAQLAGLDQAQSNAQSGINLVQTAEGALTEVHDMLNRMTTLATQSANGTYDAADRDKLQAEVNALIDEIDRIAENSNFNGTKLLDGSLSEKEVKASLSSGQDWGTVAATYTAAVNSDQKTTFEVDLKNVKFDFVATAATNTVALNVGGATLVTGQLTSDLSGDDLATQFAKTTQIAIDGVTFNVKAEDTKLVFTMSDEAAEKSVNSGSFNGNFDVSITTGAAATQGKILGKVNAGTELVASGRPSNVEKLAEVTTGVLADTDFEKDGKTFQVGEHVYVIALTDKTANKTYDSENVHTVDVRDLVSADATGTLKLIKTDSNGDGVADSTADMLNEAMTRLVSTINETNEMFDVSIKDDKSLSFMQKSTYDGDVDLGDDVVLKKLFQTEGSIKISTEIHEENKLQLQIGAGQTETIKVGVNSMKAFDLGLKGLDISSSVDAANKAIETVKNAIQTVSATRGDLGAIQNRLEHTINNLGVMEENVQDAEANIRDTDVADEMMAYTKNNILIQSAQAMLAQANQTPQGVLQLMQ